MKSKRSLDMEASQTWEEFYGQNSFLGVNFSQLVSDPPVSELCADLKQGWYLVW